MKTIGGYIELQLPAGLEYYPKLIKLNTGRHAFEYILNVKRHSLVHLPYFTCSAMLEPLQRLGIPCRFYRIDENLEPVLDFPIGEGECLVYTNYFGLKTGTARRLATEVNNLIVDNSQAFFSAPLPGIDTFYSCRKFFGAPDGAYLSLNSPVRLQLETDRSIGRFSHLIKSIDLGIEQGYRDYIANNEVFEKEPVLKMSPLTQRILSGIDYEACKEKRRRNFLHLHAVLSEYNELPLSLTDDDVPLVYPLMVSQPGIKQQLIEQKIFVATYWPNVLQWTCPSMLEYQLTDQLINLPIDHRYGIYDMDHILHILKPLLCNTVCISGH